MAAADAQGADTFWPGYVDAISNLVLNLLFVVAILTIAVFMFAMELGRRQVAKAAEAAAPAHAASAIIGGGKPAGGDVTELQREVKRLQLALAEAQGKATHVLAGSGVETKPAKVVDVSGPAVKEAPPAQLMQQAGGIVIAFSNEAVSLSADEAAKARAALAPVLAAGKARIQVPVRVGFSEARRLAFYRAMAVRNLLLEGGLAADRIDVSIPEQNGGTADGTKVQVLTP